MPNAPLVSIIMTSFNQSRFIKKSLDSLLNQTYRPIEIIVIDGGSSDGTLEILRSYGDKIVWISELDDGEYFAVNKGIKKAVGKYIKFCPSDDLMIPCTTSLCVEYMEKYKDVAMVYSQFAFIDESDRITEYSVQSIPFYLKGYLRRKFSHGSMTMMVRREVFDNIGLFDTDYSYTGDFEFICRLAYKDYKIIYLPHVFGGFRRYQEHQSARMRKVIKKQIILVVRKYGTRIDCFFVKLSIIMRDFRTILGRIKWGILGRFGKTRQTGKPFFYFHDLY